MSGANPGSGKLSVGSAPSGYSGGTQVARSMSAGVVDSRRGSTGTSTLASNYTKGQSNATSSSHPRPATASPRPAHTPTALSTRSQSVTGHVTLSHHCSGPGQTGSSLNSLPTSLHPSTSPRMAPAHSAPSSIYTSSYGSAMTGAIPRGSIASQHGSLYQSSSSNASNQSVLSTASAPPHLSSNLASSGSYPPTANSTLSLPARGSTREHDHRYYDRTRLASKSVGNGITNAAQREALRKQIQGNTSGKDQYYPRKPMTVVRETLNCLD